MRKYFSHLRGRILLLFGLTFSGVLGVMEYVANVDNARDLANVRWDIQREAERIADKQNEIIESTRQLLTVLVAARDVREFGPTSRCQQLIAQILQRESYLANIFYAAPNGDILCNATPLTRTVNVADRAYFPRALASHGIVIDAAVVSRSTGKWSIPFATAIRENAGQVQGVLVAALDLQWVGREIAKSKLPDGARVGLIDKQGIVLIREPDPENTVGHDKSDTAFFKTLISLDGRGTAEELGFDNVRRIYGFSHFAETATGPIYLWVGVSRDSVMAGVERAHVMTTLGMLIVLSLLFATIWFGSERLFVRPVSAIAETARRLGHGDHQARTGLAHTDDELGQLAGMVDNMAIALVSKSALLRLNRSLKLLIACNGVLIRAENEEQLLGNICREIVELGNYRMAWVGFAQHDAGKTVRPVARYGYDEGYVDALRITWDDTETGRGPTGSAIRTGMTQVNVNYATNPSCAPWRAEALKRDYHSSTALPLRDQAGVFGSLTIYSAQSEAFNAEEILLVQELANDLAFGIVTLRARAENRRSADRLRRGMESTIEALAGTLEMRDAYTAGHQRRVAKLAAAIALEMGLSEDEIHGIHLAGVIHDLGKIQVPAEILSKPARLSNLEYELIKTHTQAGYDILKDIDFPWPIAQMVYQHHERLDGAGYPRGLKGDEILPGAKILAVADTVEAMASHRPYRPALGIDIALQEITANRGKLYEPAIVDACVKLFRERSFKFPE